MTQMHAIEYVANAKKLIAANAQLYWRHKEVQICGDIKEIHMYQGLNKLAKALGAKELELRDRGDDDYDLTFTYDGVTFFECVFRGSSNKDSLHAFCTRRYHDGGKTVALEEYERSS